MKERKTSRLVLLWWISWISWNILFIVPIQTWLEVSNVAHLARALVRLMGKQLLDGKENTESDPAVNISNLIRNFFQSLFVFSGVTVQSGLVSVVALHRINTMKLLLDTRLCSQPAIPGDIIQFLISISLYIYIFKVQFLSQQHQTQAW